LTWRRLDHLQPLLIGMLAALGLMTVFSADADWGRQVVWVVLGAGAYVAATVFDYRRLRPLAPLFTHIYLSKRKRSFRPYLSSIGHLDKTESEKYRNSRGFRDEIWI